MSRIRQALRWRMEAFREVLRAGMASAEDRRQSESEFWNRDCQWRRLCFGHDPVLGWRFVPSLRARIPRARGYYAVRTNGAGWRSEAEFRECRSPGMTRLALVGDSFTAGDGVRNEDRFGDGLARRFGSVEILNFGLPGSGTDQQALILERFVRPMACDAVVWCIFVENIQRNTQRCWPALEWSTSVVCYRAKPYFRMDGDGLVLCHTPVPSGIRRAGSLGDWLSGESCSAGSDDALFEAYAGSSSDSWRLMAAILRWGRERIPEIPFLFVALPTAVMIGSLCRPDYSGRLNELVQRMPGCRFVDLWPAIARLPRARRRALTLPRDGHLSIEGHRFVADVLAPELAATLAGLSQPAGV